MFGVGVFGGGDSSPDGRLRRRISAFLIISGAAGVAMHLVSFSLGYYLPPYSYAMMQVLGQAVEATKSLDQQKLADYIRATEFNTVVGKNKFGKNGEWAKGRTLMVQYQKVQGTGIDQFRGPGKKVVLYPEELKSGSIIYPYAAAKN